MFNVSIVLDKSKYLIMKSTYSDPLVKSSASYKKKWLNTMPFKSRGFELLVLISKKNFACANLCLLSFHYKNYDVCIPMASH